ncbi:glutamate synthase [NADH] [Ascosphaera atra]|nr:glutamate synthase [NADH] [Ascosphaera atra]
MDQDQDPILEYKPYEAPDGRGFGWAGALPAKQGLYNPDLEKDACGVGFTAHIKGKASHKIVTDGKNMPCLKSFASMD